METEAVIWCPACKETKFTVRREPISEGVYRHVIDPIPEDTKKCQCGAALERQHG